MTKLRTGAEIPNPTVMTTVVSLNALEERRLGALSIYELYKHAQDSTYKMLPQSVEALTKIGLLRDGGILHADTAAVVLACYVIDGDDFRRVNPLA